MTDTPKILHKKDSTFKKGVDLINHYSYNLSRILEPIPTALKVNIFSFPRSIPSNSNIDLEKFYGELKDDVYYTVGPFSHKNTIYLRSQYNYYLSMDKNRVPITSYSPTPFQLEACGKSFKISTQFGNLMAGKGSIHFEVQEKEIGKRYSIRAGEKYIGIGPDGKVYLYDEDNVIDTIFHVEDDSVDRSFRIGPFQHGNWVYLESVHNHGFFRYSNEDTPQTDPILKMPFFCEHVSGTKKFRLTYYRGFIVCTVNNGYDFEVIEHSNPEKNGYTLRSGGKCLGVSNYTRGIVCLYDHFDYSETRWIVKPFNPVCFCIGKIQHLAKVKLKAYYFRDQYLRTEPGKIPIISTEGSSFVCYQMGNMFRLYNGSFPLCTDKAEHNILWVHEFNPPNENGYSFSTGDPGEQLYLGCANDGVINLYPSSNYCETRWFLE